METYDSEQEQVEAIKKWWKENGRSVIAGLVIGLGGIAGWKGWVAYQESQAVGASTAYDQLVQIVDSDREEEARQHGDRLVQTYPRSTYAALSSLLLARVSMAQGHMEDARHYLQWVIDNASFSQLSQVAALRLARLLLQEGNPDAALSLLTENSPVGLEAAYEETRGDILVAKGDLSGARTAYAHALSSLSVGSSSRDLLQMKLDDLGTPPAPQTPSPEEASS